MTDHLAKVEVDVFARLVLEAEASGTRTIPVDLYMAQQILKDLRAKDGSIPEEWRLLLRGAREDVEILTRVRDTLLKKLADQKAEFSAKEAELKRLRVQVNSVWVEAAPHVKSEDVKVYATSTDAPTVSTGFLQTVRRRSSE